MKLKKFPHESLLSVGNNSCAFPRKIIEVKRQLGEHQSHKGHRSCRACHVGRDVPASETGSHERTTKKFVAANEERIKDLSEKTIPFKSVEGVHRCAQFRSASVVKPLISMRKCRASWQCRGAG